MHATLVNGQIVKEAFLYGEARGSLCDGRVMVQFMEPVLGKEKEAKCLCDRRQMAQFTEPLRVKTVAF